ncbi:MAG: phosphoribosylformylglycinamidine synthase [Oscillospiraceae bacterium]|nr:phosphoribosylformylglycinamidine synthase [Oscillospiraceae bacterium]
MVYRVYVEKKPGLDQEARQLLNDSRSLLGIKSLSAVRLFNRYDAEGLSRELFDSAIRTVFSEPQLDLAREELDVGDATVFAVEYLPGQFDQRADSAAQCIQILSQGERPRIRSAKVYALYGALTEAELAEIKKYVINPVEAREASLEMPETLALRYELPTRVEILDGFRELPRPELEALGKKLGLAMDGDDFAFCQEHFRAEGRDPSITEIRVLDTYWSDHCRHTTFNTVIDRASFADPLLQQAWEDYLRTREELGRTKPICLMDLGTIAAKALKKAGKLAKLDESEEINACTVKIDVTVDGVSEPWLLLFKNETHNHPTEIEPFGGAATCIGGAIRDPLSGRAYVYGAMRLTGAADPLKPVSETIPGKLPQRKLVTTAAAGYSSYGNQIGLATGIVDEWYHPGYAAKRMEIGAVIAAVPQANVRRETPAPGDLVILLGGSTGRDGIGGATGSSKAHDAHSVETCGAEVQKGNAPEERKLQRLFRNPAAARMIKRCNDFGAGGVSVAIGELADGLEIDLNAVPRKYEGLDGTELAISESQERMAAVVAPEDRDAFLALAAAENLQAVAVAVVTAEPRLRMRWNGRTIVDLSRAFLDTNGAAKHISVEAEAPLPLQEPVTGSFSENLRRTVSDLNGCSHRGLSERFDSTIGAGSVLMPFGGKYQRTPVQAMVQKISLEQGHTEDCSLMSWGFNPFLSEKSPYHGAYLAVVESVCKLVATGAAFRDVYLSFQEYFERLGKDPKRWGKPLAALLGAFEAQMGLGVAAIGGKDSMSGSFEKLDVPPTLVSFAVTTAKTGEIVSPDAKAAGHRLFRLAPEKDEHGLPTAASLLRLFETVTGLMRAGKVHACYTPGQGGVAEAVWKMAIGNSLGFRFREELSPERLFGCDYGAFLLESDGELPGEELGAFTDDGRFSRGAESLSCGELLALYEGKLESVYPCNIPANDCRLQTFSYEAQNRPTPSIKVARPRVLIPAFPGTNCEVDSARAVRDARAEPEIFVIRNLSAEGIARSVEDFAARLKESQMVFIPGGFSGGDEPDGSGKFITAFFRSGPVKEGVMELLDKRDGLICGICNGFQALIKLGLVPYGRITEPDEKSPTLTFNTIARHQSKIVRTRIASNKSPWLALTQVGEVYSVPISHGEGRFLADEATIRALAANGQIATQYVDLEGRVSDDVAFNPNGSLCAVEGITSPDGRVFGKMGHAERIGSNLYQNVPGNYDLRMFEAAVRYFR